MTLPRSWRTSHCSWSGKTSPENLEGKRPQKTPSAHLKTLKETPTIGTCKIQTHLVGGFNPIEKYWSNWIISPGRGENNKYLKPPPSHLLFQVVSLKIGVLKKTKIELFQKT